MKEPTQEQIKEFWEWCGFRELDSTHIRGYDILRPDGFYYGVSFPVIDLNNLFKYAAPKLYERGYYYELLQWNSAQHKVIINKKTVGWAVTAADAISSSPALALFWAIWKVIHTGK